MKHETYYGDKYPEFMNQQIRPCEVKPQVQPTLTRYKTKGNGNIRSALMLMIVVALGMFVMLNTGAF